jgi:hypothetical protein
MNRTTGLQRQRSSVVAHPIEGKKIDQYRGCRDAVSVTVLVTVPAALQARPGAT